MAKLEKPKSIDTYPFGSVECPICVNHKDGYLETYITYGIKDLVNLISSAYWYYMIKADKTQRQDEIADLFFKLKKLLEKEKAVVGRIWSPIVIDKRDDDS